MVMDLLQALENAEKNPVLYDAFHKTHDFKVLAQIENILQKIADYERRHQ